MQDRNEKNRETKGESAALCVKGLSKRIVVVPAEENPLYEQVIYVVKDEAAGRGVSAQEVLQEAKRCLLPPREEEIVGEVVSPPSDLYDDSERVSKVLFALSGVALALSSGILIYWFFAI